MNAEGQIKKKQPPQLYMLFFAEMWERFSFYGMRALLILYMTKVFLFSDEAAYGVYAAYGALVYATPFIGGLLADKLLGYRKAVTLGAVLMALGHFAMAGPDIFHDNIFLRDVFFYSALAFLIVGNGFFKPNISSIVGGLYDEGDPRRDSGFTIFYMGVNLGAFLAPLLCGTIGEMVGWAYGFGLAGVGMLAGLLVFWRGQNSLEDNGTPPNTELLKKRYLGLSLENLVYLLSFLVVPLFALLVYKNDITEWALYIFGPFVLGYLLYIALSSEKVERERMYVILVLIVFSTMFWAFFEQAGSSITLFTDRNVDRMGAPTSIFQSVNPLFILLFAPLFSALWTNLAGRNKDLSIPTKFALGIFQLGLGFGVFVIGAMLAGDDGMVGLLFLLLGYLLHTTGELCLSPVGLSMVTKLSPKRVVAMVMGAWFLSSAFAHNVGGAIASLTSTTQYMETAVQYKPSINYTGTDTIAVLPFETVTKERGSDRILTEEERKELKKPLDTTKYYIDTFKASPIVMRIHLVEDENKRKTLEQPEYYTIRESLKPGEKFSMNARINNLDPLGDITNLSLLTQDSEKGKVSLSAETDELTFEPQAGFTGEVTLEYTACEKENTDRCDKVRVILTYDEQANHAPIALKQEVDIYEVQSTALAKNDFKINVLNLVADADGDATQFMITDKADPKKGYVSMSSNLNSFVTASKTIHIYRQVFFYIAVFAIGASLLLFLLVPLLKRWMHGVK